MVRLGRTQEGVAVGLDVSSRGQGTYIIGNTGTGKTTLLLNMIYQDIQSGHGVCVIDPHGDLIDDVMDRIPLERIPDVILFSPGDDDQLEKPLGLNFLWCDRDDVRQVRRVASTVVDTFKKLFFYSWGPRMEDLLRHSILTLLEHENTTLLELLLLLVSDQDRAYFTKDIKDPVLKHYWYQQYPIIARDDRMHAELVGSSLNKIGRFLVDPLIRNCISQPKNAFEMDKIINGGKILLVNLSKGIVGEDNAQLMGAVLVNQVLVAALGRRSIPPSQRRIFHLYVDEFQNFATESFATLQSEARKYGISVTVAHQYRSQLDDLLLGSTLNVGNLIILRVSGTDSFELAGQFDNTPDEPDLRPQARMKERVNGDGYQPRKTAKGEGVFDLVKEPRRAYSDVASEMANKLSTQSDFRAHARLVINHHLTEVSFMTDAPLGSVNRRHRGQIKVQSLSRGVARDIIEESIDQRLRNIPDLSAGSSVTIEGHEGETYGWDE